MIGLAVFLAVVVFVIGLQQILMKTLGARVIGKPIIERVILPICHGRDAHS